MATGTLTAKDEFRNTTDGWIGVVILGKHGEHQGVAVEPHGTVWLSEEEQILTANAPRKDDDNPFLPRPFERRDPKTQDVVETGTAPQLELVRRGVEIKNRRPFGAVATAEEVATPQARPDDEEQETAAAEGSLAPEEEVGTPEVAPARARRRR